MTDTTQTDVLVLGCGPAACLAASRLARSGRAVTLLGRPDPRERVEGASPRVVALLQAEGVSPDVFAPPTRRAVSWGDLPAAPNDEHVVERLVLDAALLTMARAAGVRVVEADVTARSAAGVESSAGVFTAPYVIEARGRRAPADGCAQRGPAGLAIAGWVPGAGAPGSSLTATPLGWRWQAVLPDGRHWAQITVPAQSARRASLTDVWAAFHGQDEVSALPVPTRLLSRAAELRLPAPDLNPQAIRIGDAAMALDPLSGHGLFWALSSALMLPPLLSALENGNTALAHRFYVDRVCDTFWRQARVARDFYALCSYPDSPFWTERRSWPDAEPAHADITAPFLGRKVVVQDGKLTEARVLHTRFEPDGAGFVIGLPLAPVLDRFGAGPIPPADLFTAQLPQFPPAQARNLHRWLQSRGVPVAPGHTTPTDHRQPMETLP